MSKIIVTGSSGLIGSETVEFFCKQGHDVIGIDNDMRAYFFGKDGSTAWKAEALKKQYKTFSHETLDIRDQNAIFALFKKHGKEITSVIHTAAQPSHDWAAREPFTDFSVNAQGTLVLLEATRQFCPEAPFVFTSTNKVYGDTPNLLPLVENETRWEVQPNHPYAQFGIDEKMSIDHCKHSVFGASKVAADVMTQEYGRYFGMKTVVMRGGCLTGPSHSGAELHGFLAYLVKCVLTGRPYTIFGYKGKQVRDNIHSADLVSAISCFLENPTSGRVYNMGGSRHSHCSMLEAIAISEELAHKKLSYEIVDQARSGDHIWWVSDVRKFQTDYPKWHYQYTLKDILAEMVASQKERL